MNLNAAFCTLAEPSVICFSTEIVKVDVAAL